MSKELIKIAKESKENLRKGSAEEMTDLIFDTLFGNIDFPQFNIDNVTIFEKESDTSQEVNRNKKEITFGYMKHTYKIKVELIQ